MDGNCCKTTFIVGCLLFVCLWFLTDYLDTKAFVYVSCRTTVTSYFQSCCRLYVVNCAKIFFAFYVCWKEGFLKERKMLSWLEMIKAELFNHALNGERLNIFVSLAWASSNPPSPTLFFLIFAIFDILRVAEVCLVNVVPAGAYIVPAPNSGFSKLNIIKSM